MPGASSDPHKNGTPFKGFYVMLHPRDLHKEVNRIISVPGSFWKGECLETDWDKMFTAKVTEVEMTHKFAGVGMKQPAVRFELIGSAADLVDSTPLWMSSKAYSELVHPENVRIKLAAAEALKAVVEPEVELVAEMPGACSLWVLVMSFLLRVLRVRALYGCHPHPHKGAPTPTAPIRFFLLRVLRVRVLYGCGCSMGAGSMGAPT
jgi:hypothetical protein